MTSQEQHVLGHHSQHDHDGVRREEAGATIEVREEELAARKQTVETGRVSLGTEVVEEQRTLQVPFTRDEVTIERHAVDRPLADEPISATDEVLSVPVREERVSVDKQAVVYEEVNLGKQAVQETRQVSGTVRKEVVDVDAEGNIDMADHARERR